MDEAAHWYRKAAAQGSEPAAQNLQLLNAQCQWPPQPPSHTLISVAAILLPLSICERDVHGTAAVHVTGLIEIQPLKKVGAFRIWNKDKDGSVFLFLFLLSYHRCAGWSPRSRLGLMD